MTKTVHKLFQFLNGNYSERFTYCRQMLISEVALVMFHEYKRYFGNKHSSTISKSLGIVPV